MLRAAEIQEITDKDTDKRKYKDRVDKKKYKDTIENSGFSKPGTRKKLLHFIIIHNVTEYYNTEYIVKIESHVLTGIVIQNKNYSFCLNQMLFFPLVFFPTGKNLTLISTLVRVLKFCDRKSHRY